MFRIGTQPVTIIRQFEYIPKDVSLAFTKSAIARYGENSLCGAKIWHLFRSSITYISIKVGYNHEDKGIVNRVQIENSLLRADFVVCPQDDSGQRPEIHCFVKPKYRKEAEKFLDAIKEYLDKNSIYKGKAFETNGDFLNVSDVDESKFIYSSETLQLIKANIWTMIEQPERCARVKIKRQRKVLLAGPYGAGKTFTALLTAKKAVTNGLTFVYMPPTEIWDKNAILRGLSIARKYQPAVFFLEDIDHEQRFDSDHTFKKILSNTDGLISKNDEILIVMTTNRPDKINGALLRPGRIDKIIDMGKLTKQDIERMIASVIDKNFLAENIGWNELAEICLELSYPPAFILEIATNALLLMISEDKEKVTTEMLVQSAEGLRKQVKACEQSIGFSRK